MPLRRVEQASGLRQGSDHIVLGNAAVDRVRPKLEALLAEIAC